MDQDILTMRFHMRPSECMRISDFQMFLFKDRGATSPLLEFQSVSNGIRLTLGVRACIIPLERAGHPECSARDTWMCSCAFRARSWDGAMACPTWCPIRGPSLAQVFSVLDIHRDSWWADIGPYWACMAYKWNHPGGRYCPRQCIRSSQIPIGHVWRLYVTHMYSFKPHSCKLVA